jgi:chromosome segregation ATPase
MEKPVVPYRLTMDVDASHFDQNEPVNANNALMQEKLDAKLGAIAAFHRWRHSQLVNRFRRSLQDLASEVEEAETQAESQRQELSAVKESHQEALTINVQLSSDLESALRQLDATRNDLAQCRGEVDMQERASKIAHEESARLRLAMEAAMKGKDEERNARRAESEGLKEQHSALLQQQQQLMTQLSQRDAKVIELSAESKRFQSRIEALELEARQLRAESNKMGERASAAEASSKASLASEAKMRSELDALRVSYLKDLSELKAARISRSEVSALKEQLESAQCISSSMVKARDEIRVNLDICSSQLVSAEEKLRRQSSFVSLKEQLIKMASQQGASTNDSAVVEVLSAELEAKMEEISLLAAKTASLNAILTQSQAQVERLAQEKSELAGSLDLESVKRRHLASLVAELQAEMQRMVAESSLPPLEQRAEGSSPSDQPVAAAKAPAPLSTMETQTTALRVLIATKLPSFHDLEARLSPLLPNEANLKSSPLSSLPQAMTQLEVVMRESRAVSNGLEGLSELLGSRPVPIQTLIDALGSTRSSLDSAALLSFASNSDEMQLDLVSLDGKLQGAEEVLQHASSLLAGWTSLMSQMMGQGRAVDEALRQRIKSELVAVEESIHSTLMKLSSPETHQGGIVKVEVELALRGVQNSVMELSNLIASDRDAVPDSRARSHAQHCETLAKEKTAVVSRHRSQLAKVPGFIGSVSSCAQACAEDEFVLIEGIDSMLDLLRQLQDKAKGEAPIDPVVLQGEIYALRSQLKLMDKMVKELKEAASAALGSSDASKPRVPFEAMQALTQAHDSAVEERSKLRAAMATQRMRMANGRLIFVEYFESLRSSSLAFLSFAVWREKAAQERARRAQELADKTQASLDSIILTCTSRR